MSSYGLRFVYSILFLSILAIPVFSQTVTVTEGPETLQLYGRDNQNKCQIPISGTTSGSADSVLVKVFGNGSLLSNQSQGFGAFNFSFEVDADTVEYSIHIGSKTGSIENIQIQKDSVVCGDVIIITGQSNALVEYPRVDLSETSQWVRTYGSSVDIDRPEFARGFAHGGVRAWAHIGLWGLELGKKIVNNHGLPILIFNGAKGGTRVDQHQRSEATPDGGGLYGHLLGRVKAAKLTNKVSAVIWHQGENDQGADGFGIPYHSTYLDLFTQMYAGWRNDYPNIKYVYVWQIRPACGGKGPEIREIQRSLKDYLPRIRMMTSFGIKGYEGCHYDSSGYLGMADKIYPLMANDLYCKPTTGSATPPRIEKAAYYNKNKDAVILVFDQELVWEDSLLSPRDDALITKIGQKFLKDYILLDDSAGTLVSGRDSANSIIINLSSASTAKTITYIDGFYNGSNETYQGPYLMGKNNLAALSFHRFPIRDSISAPVFIQSMDNKVAHNLKLLYTRSHGIFRINYTGPNVELKSIRVQNILGQRVNNQLFVNKSLTKEIQLDYSSLNKGVYYVTVTTDEFNKTFKVILF